MISPGILDHIVHHLLTLFSLGAAPDSLRDAYQRGHSYQRPVEPTNEDVIHELLEKKQFKDYLGKEEHYPNFLEYFQREIAAKGMQSVVNEHLFAGDEHADDLLIRMFSGIVLTMQAYCHDILIFQQECFTLLSISDSASNLISPR